MPLRVENLRRLGWQPYTAQSFGSSRFRSRMGEYGLCRWLGRRTDRVGDLGAAGAGQPDVRTVPPAVQFAAPLVLVGEGYKGL